MPAVLSIERTVSVEIRVNTTDPDEAVTPPDSRPIMPAVVKLTYAGRGYVMVEVRGPYAHGRHGSAGGYWTHLEGRSDPGNPRDTSHAPAWLRELAEAYAPADFTATS